MSRCPYCNTLFVLRPVEIYIPWRDDTGPVRIAGRDVQEYYCPACGYSSFTPQTHDTFRWIMDEVQSYDAERVPYNVLW